MRIERYDGDRSRLRPLFELADDSELALASSIDAGDVYVAYDDDEPIGHVQLVDTDEAHVLEIKNMAVAEPRQGTGVGRALVEHTLGRALVGGATRVLVATGTADVGILRFYQRLGFRMLSIERDAFTPAQGYPESLEAGGIPVVDRVWFDQELGDRSRPHRQHLGEPVHVAGISGSLKQTSANSALLRELATAASDTIFPWDGLGGLPHFTPDDDGGASVASLRAAVQEADAVLIATPEYAGGMPGALKNALDWLVGTGELYDKPVVIVSAAPAPERGVHARDWVEQVVGYQGAHVVGSFTVAPGDDRATVLARVLDALTPTP